MRSTVAIITLALAGLALATPALADATLSETIAELETRIAASPNDPDLWQRRAELERRRDNLARASEDLERAGLLGLSPAVLERDRGLLLVAASQPAEAELALRRARTLAPADTTILLAQARALASLARWRDAADAYAALMRLTPSANPDVHLERVRALEGLGEPGEAEAMAALDQALKQLGSVPALEQAALALEIRSGRTDEALVRLDRLAAKTRRPEAFLVQRGEILERADRADAAAAAYGAALAAMETLPAQRRSTPAANALAQRAQDGITRLAARPQGDAR